MGSDPFRWGEEPASEVQTPRVLRGSEVSVQTSYFSSRGGVAGRWRIGEHFDAKCLIKKIVETVVAMVGCLGLSLGTHADVSSGVLRKDDVAEVDSNRVPTLTSRGRAATSASPKSESQPWRFQSCICHPDTLRVGCFLNMVPI